MEKFQLGTHYSLWFIGVCLLAGACYAFFLYTAKSPWGKRLNQFLAILRFCLVALLCFLLLEPFFNHITNEFEKPIVVIAVDNSKSMVLGSNGDSVRIQKTLSRFEQKFAKQGYRVEFRSFDGPVDTAKGLSYQQGSTNIHRVIESIGAEYEGLHLDRVVLISDGIVNKGVSPEFIQAPFPVSLVGTGDTVPKRDVQLRTVFYNKISYQGNEFPLVAELAHYGFDNQEVNVFLQVGDKTLDQKTVVLRNAPAYTEVSFKATSEKEGVQHYVIRVAPVDGEFTQKNNVRHAYVDVINSKQKIVLFAASPHPDIKAIKSAIDKKEKYELIVNVLSTSQSIDQPEDASLIIFHQLPNQSNVGSDIVLNYANKKIPKLFYVGNRSNIRAFNEINNTLSISQRSNQVDEVNAHFNQDFTKFSTEPGEFDLFKKAPPVQVPFGEYGLKGTAEVILYQQIGSILTEKPLVLYRDDQNGVKTACVVGEDTWRWRLFEYLETEDTKAFDTFFQKLFQLLASKDDKRKLRVRPILESFDEGEVPAFTIETYNDIYERVYDKAVTISVTNEKGESESFEFVTAKGKSNYRIKALTEGVYQFSATAMLAGKKQAVNGAFVISKQLIESTNLVANHRVLRSLARKNNGVFVSLHDDLAIEKVVGTQEGQQLIHTSEQEIDVVDFIWLLGVLVLIVAVEWSLRKANGGY